MEVLWLFGGMFALILLAAALPHPDKPPQNPDEMSVGYLRPGVCMSADKFNWAADMVVKNTNWSQFEGSATFSASTKSLVGATTVFREMARLGTPACPDLAPLYSQYLVATQKPAGEAPKTSNQRRGTTPTGDRRHQPAAG